MYHCWKATGVWNCHATCGRQKTTISTSIVYGTNCQGVAYDSLRNRLYQKVFDLFFLLSKVPEFSLKKKEVNDSRQRRFRRFNLTFMCVTPFLVVAKRANSDDTFAPTHITVSNRCAKVQRPALTPHHASSVFRKKKKTHAVVNCSFTSWASICREKRPIRTKFVETRRCARFKSSWKVWRRNNPPFCQFWTVPQFWTTYQNSFSEKKFACLKMIQNA